MQTFLSRGDGRGGVNAAAGDGRSGARRTRGGPAVKSAFHPLRTFLLLCSLLPAALAFPPSGRAEASQEISVDTVWKGVVEVGGEVRVLGGATLLVTAGTTVRFSRAKKEDGDPRARLIVQGTLIAQGTKEKPILFTSAAADPAPGDWGGILFERANSRPNRVRFAEIEYASEGIGGAYSLLLVEDTTIRGCGVGVAALRDLKGGLFQSTVIGNRMGLSFNQSSGLLVEKSAIRDNAEGGILCYFSSSPAIRHCTITGNGTYGVSCSQGASPVVEGCVISGQQRGITMELKSRPLIVRNEISGNDTGIWAEKLVFPRILGNVISGNGRGIYCNYSGYPEIHGNNIVGNGSFALVLGDNMSIVMEKQIPFRSMGRNFDTPPTEPQFLPPQTRKFTPFTASEEGIVDARGNWWGKEALQEMETLGTDGNISVIEDFHDKPDTWYKEKTYRRDRVDFSSWEGKPLEAAGPPEQTYSDIRGKVIFEGKGLPGARVHVYRDAGGSFSGEGFSFSAPTGEDGSFSLHLGTGSYYLVAKKTEEGFPHRDPGPGEFFGYYGGNPVAVAEGGDTESNIQVVRKAESSSSVAEGQKGAVVEGAVIGPEGPVEGASIHVYTDASRQFRGPGLFGPQGAVIGGTDSSGRFSIDLPPGIYYLVASKRGRGGFLGPLQPGDLHGFYDGNPVEAEAGRRMRVTLQTVKKLKESGARAAPGPWSSGIRGTIRDPSGKVPAGVYAYATTDPSFMIGAMPPYRSQPVAEDGSFTIDLPGGSTYYVGARSGYGGPPLPGEWHGFFGGDAPDPIAVEKGSIREGVDFTVRKME